MEQALETGTYTSDRSRLINQALGGRAAARTDISRRPRLNEQIIRILLFAAGVFSIFTTAFIVIFLGTEAVSFFGARAWIHAKQVVVDASITPLTLRSDNEAAITTTSTLLLLDVPQGQRVPYAPGSLVRVEDEVMKVVERRERSIVVERGQAGTQPQVHRPGTPVLPLVEASIKIVEPLPADATRIVLPEGTGALFSPGQPIMFETETVLITAIEGDVLTVERGHEGTIIREHPAGSTVEVERRPSLLEFFTSTNWQPQTGNFGILPLVEGTLITTFIALLTAVPVGMAAAIYLSEYATPKVRGILNPILEILVGVPTVVYGFFALQFVTRGVLRPLLGVDIYNTLSAGLVVGIMIVPTIASMSIDAMGAVPRGLREASYGLGATKLETIIRVVLPAALSGMVAAVILGMSRAIGETMIVAIAAGAGPNWTWPPNTFVGAETMTGHINRISGGDLSYASIDYTSIFAIGMTLFVMTFILTQISTWITQRFREMYE